MEFIGNDYESLRIIFRYALSDLPYIKLACDRLTEFSQSTTENITGVDYVRSVKDLIISIKSTNSELATKLVSTESQVKTETVFDHYTVTNQDGFDNGISGNEAVLNGYLNDLLTIFEDYGLYFQQPHLVKS